MHAASKLLSLFDTVVAQVEVYAVSRRVVCNGDFSFVCQQVLGYDCKLSKLNAGANDLHHRRTEHLLNPVPAPTWQVRSCEIKQTFVFRSIGKSWVELVVHHLAVHWVDRIINI